MSPSGATGGAEEPVACLVPPGWRGVAGLDRMLAALGGTADAVRIVGGPVRDALIGRPVSNIDLATVWAPDESARRLAAAGIHAWPSGIAHGTISALADGMLYEVTTLRHDVATDGRRAVVAFGADWRADAARRDFTINALFSDGEGRIYDPVGGLADLARGRVRFVGDPARRIAEDRLRVLRFFRFQAGYGRTPPEPAALDACAAAAVDLVALSGERLWQEASRLLVLPGGPAAAAAMAARGVLAVVLPQLDRADRLARLAALEAAHGVASDPLRRLAAWAGLPGAVDAAARAAALATRLRLSRAEARRLEGLAAWPDAPAMVSDGVARRAAVHRLGPGRVVDLALLAAADGDDGSLPAWLAEAGAWRERRLPLDGDDLIALGVARGPEIGRLLAAVEDWWLGEDRRPGRDACLARAAALLGRDGA